jgi:hypothetical protein
MPDGMDDNDLAELFAAFAATGASERVARAIASVEELGPTADWSPVEAAAQREATAAFMVANKMLRIAKQRREGA